LIRRRKSVGDCTLLTLLLGWFVCRQANACSVRWGVLFFLGSACVSPNWLAGLCRNTAKLSAELRLFEKSGQDFKGLFFSCLVDGCCVVIGLLVTFVFMTAAAFEARLCPTWPNEIKKNKLQFYMSPAAGINILLCVRFFLSNLIPWSLILFLVMINCRFSKTLPLCSG